jgi:predicted nucleotidyltransferase
MRELDAFLPVGGLDDATAKALPVVVDDATLARLETSTWRTDAGYVDVLATIRDSQGRRLGIEDIEDRAATVVVVGVTVRLASLDDIIESKRFADRHKDREALTELERLRDERS